MPGTDVHNLMQQGVEHHLAGRLREAEGLYRQVLSAEPNQPDALHLLGMVALGSNRPDQAVELIGRAIAVQPGVADYHYNLGCARMILGRAADAAEAFGRAVSLNPKLFPAYSNLAAAFMTLQRYDRAIEASKAALALNAEHGETWNNFGVALKELGRVDEAIDALQHAAKFAPQSPEPLTNLGNALQLKRDFAAAVEMHRRAIAIRPDAPQLHNNFGSALYDMLEYEPAIAAYKRALELRPDYREALTTLANCYYRLGRLEEGIAYGRRAVELWPESALPKFNLSLMLLSNGEFAEGWRLNEARWDVPRLNDPQRKIPKLRWDGSDLNGKTILLHGEQGFGDTIQFVRYIPMVRAKGGSIILGCQEELIRLLRNFEGVEQILSRADSSLQFDVHCPLMSLPLMFGTDLANIPAPESYITPDPTIVEQWRGRISAPEGERRIGLAWAGRSTHENDRNRSMTLAQFSPLLDVENCKFCSLQKGEAAAQAAHEPRILDLSEQVRDFADLAGIIANLDLVITVDTAAAHLAAAMGKPTWVLLPYAPDWRWLYGRDDSPWYPTMRLFRQPRARDWESVIQSVLGALEKGF